MIGINLSKFNILLHTPFWCHMNCNCPRPPHNNQLSENIILFLVFS